MPLTFAETPLYYRDSQGQYHRVLSGADMTGYRTAAAQDAIDESRTFEHAASGFRWYVDGVNGNDANAGTQAAPWKTMDKFFSMANSTANGRADIRCFIVSAGTYDITQQTFTALAIHITGVDGVILNFTTSADVKFYECHVNLNTLSIQAPNATEFTFDGGSIAIDNVTFNMPLYIYSIAGYIRESMIKSLVANYSNLLIHACTLTNTDPTVNGYTFAECMVRFSGASYNNDLTADGTDNAFISAASSQMMFGITYRATTHRYAYGLSAIGSIITSNETWFNNLKTRSVNGINYNGLASSVFMLSDANPASYSSVPAFGLLSGTNKTLDIYALLPNDIPNGATITVTELLAALRVPTGGYIESNGYDILNNSTVTASHLGGQLVMFRCIRTTAWYATNNIPVTGTIKCTIQIT